MSGTTHRLWIDSKDLERLHLADSVCFLLGGYEGAGNYGDIVQLAASIERLAPLPILPVALVSAAYADDHRALVRQWPGLFGDACFLYFAPRGGRHSAGNDDALVPLADPPPGHAHVLVYGGGFFNDWWDWGRTKLEVHDLLVRWLGRSDSRLRGTLVTGQQISYNALASATGKRLRRLLRAASVIGVRDQASGQIAAAQLPRDAAARIIFSGDDATGYVLNRLSASRPRTSDIQAVNVHLSLAGYVTSRAEFMLELAADAVETAIRAISGNVLVRLVSAYGDSRTSDTPYLERLRERLAGSPAGIESVECLATLIDDPSVLVDTDLTISCSYHVALTSLLAGVPTVLLGDNAYYQQKHAGLAEVFGQPQQLVHHGDEDIEGLQAAIARVLTDEQFAADVRVAAGRGVAAMAAASAGATVRVSQALARAGLDHLRDRHRETIEQLREATEQLSDLQLDHERLLNAATEAAGAEAIVAGVPYERLVERVRNVVERLLPPGCTVAVVSKGDDSLLLLGERTGWHFPQTPEGIYTGYHPAGAGEAIAHVESARARGADFLLFPATSIWWLEHYDELKHHLDQEYRPVVEDEACVAYALTPAAAALAIERRGADHERRLAELRQEVSGWQLRERGWRLIQEVVPPGATLVLVGVTAPPQLRERDVWQLGTVSAENEGRKAALPGEAIAEFEALRKKGAHFAVFVQAGLSWLAEHPDVRQYMELRYGKPVLQEDVCLVFMLDDTFELRAQTKTLETQLDAMRKEIGRREMVEAVRRAVNAAVPEDASVLVVSRGDDDLLQLSVRQAGHFPQTDDGMYAGHYPATSEAAITHLEELRARGVDFLVFPSTAQWWLEHYVEFAQHLERYARKDIGGECVIYRLSVPNPPGGSVRRMRRASRRPHAKTKRE
jgi:polysaccharide pyruvyl transferase WcaK-like protein